MKKDMTSVIIPIINEKYIDRTIKSVIDNASGKVEVIVIIDGTKEEVKETEKVGVIRLKTNQGGRKAINLAAKEAVGEYLFKLDGHCTMSKDWDVKLKTTTPDRGIAVSVICPLNEKTWEITSERYTFCRLKPSMQEKWWNRKITNVVMPTMTFTGCGWMMKKDYYESFGGFDESLPVMGASGPELSLRAWLEGEGVFLRTDVLCGHLFNTGGYSSQDVINARRSLKEKWGDRYQELVDKFPEVVKYNEMEEIVDTIKVQKKQEIVTKNSSGEIVRKIIKYYIPVPYSGKEDVESDKQKALDVCKKAKLEKVEVFQPDGEGGVEKKVISKRKELVKLEI